MRHISLVYLLPDVLGMCGQVAPQLARDEAPVSGAVRWSRALFVRLKRTWARLQQQEKEALEDAGGQRVRL